MISGDLCPIGTYNNMTGLRAFNECAPCTPGFYCPYQGIVQPTLPCAAGHFCELGSIEPSPVAQTYGYLCPVGHYCPQGTPAPVPCAAGFYQPNTGEQDIGACLQCTAGYYCLGNGLDAVSGQCDAGYYCTLQASVPNPTGMWSNCYI